MNKRRPFLDEVTAKTWSWNLPWSTDVKNVRITPPHPLWRRAMVLRHKDNLTLNVLLDVPGFCQTYGCLVWQYIYIYIYIYRVSHELRSLLWESVPYVKIYRYNPKHLYPKLNGYGDIGQRKVWCSCGFHVLYPNSWLTRDPNLACPWEWDACRNAVSRRCECIIGVSRMEVWRMCGICNVWVCMYGFCNVCVLVICVPALFGYHDWGFSVLFPQL